MRILIPVLEFSRAGGYRVLSELANAWIRRGHAVTFLCPDSSEGPYFPTAAKILWTNANGTVSTQRVVQTKRKGWRNLLALYRALRAIGRQYDVVLANHSLTAWPVALASCGAARKFYYVQAYEPGFYTASPTAKNLALATISALSYHLPLERIVNAPVYFRYKNLRASICVPPGIDLSVFRPSAASPDLATADSILIGCIGRREPEKGTIYVLRAFEELCRQDSRYLLRVAYGNLPPHWGHSRCEVVVPRNDAELAEFYRGLDVLVAAGTVQHGSPHYPVLESWACGVPVVTTAYMGATERSAWLVDNRNPDSICSAVKALVADPVARQQRIQEGLLVASKYAWDQVAEQMLEILSSHPRISA